MSLFASQGSAMIECASKLQEVYEFRDVIGLHSLFGVRESPETSFNRMMWAAKCYEIAKHEVSWETQQKVSIELDSGISVQFMLKSLGGSDDFGPTHR